MMHSTSQKIIEKSNPDPLIQKKDIQAIRQNTMVVVGGGGSLA